MSQENIIMGHYQNITEINDKEVWLNRYYPKITERILTLSNISKADSIIDYCSVNNIDLDDVIFVDDIIPFLQEAERKGIKSYHISSFLDWDYQKEFKFI